MKRICKEKSCKNTVKGRFKFCHECGLQRRRSAARAQYHDSAAPWEPYKKLCKHCRAEFTVEDPDKANTVYCRVCAPLVKKSWHREYKRKQSMMRRKTGLSSAGLKTLCKCPACEGIHYLKLLLRPKDRVGVDAGVPWRKFCYNCKNMQGYDNYCNIADAHSIGGI